MMTTCPTPVRPSPAIRWLRRIMLVVGLALLVLVGYVTAVMVAVYLNSWSPEPLTPHVEQIAAALQPDPTDLALLPAPLQPWSPRSIGLLRSECLHDECAVPPSGVAIEVNESFAGGESHANVIGRWGNTVTHYVFRSDELARRFFDANRFETFGDTHGFHTPQAGTRPLDPPPGVSRPARCLVYDAGGVHDARCRVLVGSVVVESHVIWTNEAFRLADPTLPQKLVAAGIGPAERAQQGAPPP